MRLLRHFALLMLWGGALTVSAQAQEQRPHAYAFDNPELVSTQRVFGVGNATILLGEACKNFPEAAAAYAAWLTANENTLTVMTDVLAVHYRIPVTSEGLRLRVANAMHLKTDLNLSEANQDEVCPNLPETLALPHMNLQQRYWESLAEVRDPNYLSPKRKFATSPPPAMVTEEKNHD